MYIVDAAWFGKFLEMPKIRDRLLFTLLHDLGLRSTEVTTIRVSDIDLEARTIQILDSKKKQYFTLPLSDRLVKLIAAYIPTCTSHWLFPSNWSKNHIGIELVQYLTKKYAAEFGLPSYFHPRMFRRRLARQWIRKDGNILDLQRVLRHKRLSTTSIYADGIRFADEEQQFKAEYNRIVG